METKLTVDDIRLIVELYEEYSDEVDRDYRDWQMDEDQIGIPNPYLLSKDDICGEVLRRFNRIREKELNHYNRAHN